MDLRRPASPERPSPDLPLDVFENFHATFRVQTFDDIDVFVNIAVKTLSLSSMATMGLRELVVNAIEPGNLEISFDEKSEFLATVPGKPK